MLFIVTVILIKSMSVFFFRMFHFVFLGYLVSKLVLLKVNQNIMIPNFKRWKQRMKYSNFFGPVSIAVSDW